MSLIFNDAFITSASFQDGVSSLGRCSTPYVTYRWKMISTVLLLKKDFPR